MFQGSIVAIVTPMLDNGVVDFDSLQTLVKFHIKEGTDAIVSVGTTGESATLSMEEHSVVIKKTIEYAGGKIPVIAGTGANSTTEALELTDNAKAAGAAACLLVTPYYNKPPQEGLYQHFRKIAESVDIPQILYNVPGRTSVDMTPETTARLAEIDNIIGTKEARGTVERIEQLVKACPPDFRIFTGDDGTAMESILAGAHGNISVTANVAPALMHQMCIAALNKDEATARSIDAKLTDLNSALFIESSPIPVKWALQQMGLIGSGIRLPLVPLSTGCHSDVAAALKKAGVHG
ncbi:4-hydroxy-tetrahydrodipicolinate synthase [Chromatiales bacterium (ex Bugula neritina AB1)]|nr:4-hydroxy-tetrahydrodipicolinate synthase [Chromatiales bacterium (ex Bugula neritina AB1)]